MVLGYSVSLPTNGQVAFSKRRLTPDVSMDAAPDTGMKVGFTMKWPDGSTRYSEVTVGGTSLASPLLAGMVALADQSCACSLGFLNPALYAHFNTSVFRDVKHQAFNVVLRQFTDGFSGHKDTFVVSEGPTRGSASGRDTTE